MFEANVNNVKAYSEAVMARLIKHIVSAYRL